ncbi:MAG TPA: hypothetical protein VKJ47_20155 [Candidatus Binatia bacterium]|nr:hypothetical protein [Candidatus Binatia bacterium]
MSSSHAPDESQGVNPYEYECARCGIRVIHCTPPPPESLYGLECRFIESIEDPQSKEAAIRFLQNRPTADPTTPE